MVALLQEARVSKQRNRPLGFAILILMPNLPKVLNPKPIFFAT